MTFLLLYLLATCDAAFTGIRAAEGRSALIYKGVYYARAMAIAALLGQAAVASAGLAIAVLLALSAHPWELFETIDRAFVRLLQVYLPYAAIIFLAFAVRALPNVDIRSMTSVLIFGPFTFIRPLVAIGGVAWAVACVPRWEVIVIAALVLAMMFALEAYLYWLWSPA